jgi:hypothetical protein
MTNPTTPYEVRLWFDEPRVILFNTAQRCPVFIELTDIPELHRSPHQLTRRVFEKERWLRLGLIPLEVVSIDLFNHNEVIYSTTYKSPPRRNNQNSQLILGQLELAAALNLMGFASTDPSTIYNRILLDDRICWRYSKSALIWLIKFPPVNL